MFPEAATRSHKLMMPPLLSQLAEEYEGFSEIECEDFIDLCDEYGITSEIEEDDFEEVKEKLEDMEIPELDDEWI